MGLWHHLAQQFRQPTGFLGRLAGFSFRINLEGIDWTISLLEIQSTDHMLEIGLGPGHGIQQVAKIAAQGRVVGVDFSETMLQQASRRNAEAIAESRVELCLGDASVLLYPDNTFHKVYATNVFYFWTDPLANLQELRRVMKPSARLALYVIAKDDLLKFKVTQTGLYQLYTGDDLVRLLTQSGFSQRPIRHKVRTSQNWHMRAG